MPNRHMFEVVNLIQSQPPTDREGISYGCQLWELESVAPYCCTQGLLLGFDQTISLSIETSVIPDIPVR